MLSSSSLFLAAKYFKLCQLKLLSLSRSRKFYVIPIRHDIVIAMVLTSTYRKICVQNIHKSLWLIDSKYDLNCRNKKSNMQQFFFHIAARSLLIKNKREQNQEGLLKTLFRAKLVFYTFCFCSLLFFIKDRKSVV